MHSYYKIIQYLRPERDPLAGGFETLKRSISNAAGIALTAWDSAPGRVVARKGPGVVETERASEPEDLELCLLQEGSDDLEMSASFGSRLRRAVGHPFQRAE